VEESGGGWGEVQRDRQRTVKCRESWTPESLREKSAEAPLLMAEAPVITPTLARFRSPVDVQVTSWQGNSMVSCTILFQSATSDSFADDRTFDEIYINQDKMSLIG
jgi:hypothetical protein